MSVIIYDEDDHPGHYQGLRIVRQVGGEYRQAYMPFRQNGQHLRLEDEQRMIAEALEQDRRWADEQEEVFAIRRQQARPTRQRTNGATGVAGITLMMRVDRQMRGGEWRTYYHPCFYVCGQHRGKRFYRHIHVNKWGPAEAWRQACVLYAWKKEIDSAPLRARIPDPAAFVEQFLESWQPPQQD